MKYYHIDRSGLLNEGQTISTNQSFIPNNDYGKLLIEKFFPNGVSKHGEHYLNDNVYMFQPNFSLVDNILKSNTINSIYFAEYTFELVRRLYFSTELSRYTSLFALENLEELNLWSELKSGEYRIFEIVTNNTYSTFDANFLKGGLCVSKNPLYQGFSPSINFNQAFSYWSKEKSNNPKPEVLLPLPLTIGRRVL